MTTKSAQIFAICIIFLGFALLFATAPLDGDEFTFVKEPYELIGGDYARGYLDSGEVGNALSVASSFRGVSPGRSPLAASCAQNAMRTIPKMTSA